MPGATVHALIWTSAGQRFAIDSSRVREVLPLVETIPLVNQPAWVGGLINYRERLIPLLDMAVLLGFTSPEPRMSHRILVIQVNEAEADVTRWLGVRVDSVLGLHDLTYGNPQDHPAAQTSSFDFLGPVSLTESGTIQWVDANRIPLPDQAARSAQ